MPRRSVTEASISTIPEGQAEGSLRAFPNKPGHGTAPALVARAKIHHSHLYVKSGAPKIWADLEVVEEERKKIVPVRYPCSCGSSSSA